MGTDRRKLSYEAELQVFQVSPEFPDAEPAQPVYLGLLGDAASFPTPG